MSSLTVELPFAVRRAKPLAAKQKVRVVSRTGDNTTLTITSATPMQHVVVIEF